MALFQVVEHGLGHLPFTEKQVVTPTGMNEGRVRELRQLVLPISIPHRVSLFIWFNFLI